MHSPAHPRYRRDDSDAESDGYFEPESSAESSVDEDATAELLPEAGSAEALGECALRRVGALLYALLPTAHRGGDARATQVQRRAPHRAAARLAFCSRVAAPPGWMGRYGGGGGGGGGGTVS